LKLTTLLEGLNKGPLSFEILQGGTEKEICGLAYDTRELTADSVFVCLKGTKLDSHDLAPKAVESGASVLITERAVEVPADVTVVKVESTRKALALLAAAWFGYPAEELQVVGVTGTKGKTTTTHMLKAILEENGSKTGLIGTIGAFVDGEKIPTKNTTPESYELHRIFREMLDRGCKYAVMEVSSQALKMDRVYGITFACGVFLNISPDHISPEEHPDFEDYLYCKTLLFPQCRQAVLNWEAEHWQDMEAACSCPVITFGMGPEADRYGDNIKLLRGIDFLGCEFKYNENGWTTWVKINMPGVFSVANALAALTVGRVLGVSMVAAARALEKVTVRGRVEVQKIGESFTLLIDYAHNALSMENILSMVKAYSPRKIVCLFGGGGNRPVARRYDMGEISAKYADLTILTMDNPRYEEIESINNDIKKGLAVHEGKYLEIEDRETAIRYALDHADPGDVIVLIGKGHEEYQDVKGEKIPFSEKAIVAAWAQERKEMFGE